MKETTDKNYKKSNNIEVVKLNKFSKVEYNKLLNSTTEKRQANAQNLIDYLCDKFKMKRIKVTILDQKRPKNGLATKHGFIRVTATKTDREYVRGHIYIYNLTAVRGEIVSIKEFINTLLHEFIHAYDYEVLKLEKSIHSAGFYKRISDLDNKLK